MNASLGVDARIMVMVEFTLRQTTTAPIEKVFDVLTNHRGIAEYMPLLRRSTLDREGTPAPNGVGAVRRLEAVGPAIVEEIIDYQRPTGYTYKLISGAPVRDHVGTVTLREAGTGTEATWHLRSTPKIPGLGLILAPVLKKIIGDLFKGAIGVAERDN
jgi:uncharacterized protein YndB with AHSA1/START domain